MRSPETYGVPVEQIVEGINTVYARLISILTCVWHQQVRYVASWRRTPSEFDPRKFLKVTMDAMGGIVTDRYEAFGAAGQASKISAISLEDMADKYGL